MIRTMSALILAVAASLCSAAGQPLQLVDNAPDHHVVVRGDTLWDISAQFLKDPWRWPEIWQMNRAQIKDPHWIYPGDVIFLEWDENGNPRLRLKSRANGTDKLQPKIYSESMAQIPIPPIAAHVIEPFISQPLVGEAGELDDAAHIVAAQEGRVFLGNGDTAYVDGADEKRKIWQIYRKGKALLDPSDRTQVLGYEAFYLGSAEQVRPGNPATFKILAATQEVGRGDQLVPTPPIQLIDYVPHKPEVMIEGRVVSIYGGVGEAGRGSIVSVNKGIKDGLEVGHVLSMERNRVVTQRNEMDEKFDVQIPAERTGLLFVFRTFDRISYGLILQASGTIDTNDFVRTP